jgi:PAS domain S-box-containing protein
MPPDPDNPRLDPALRHAFVAAPNALVICAVPSLEVCSANPAAERLLGGAAGLAGRLDPPPVWAGEPAPAVAWLTRPDQDPVPVEVRASLVPGSEPPLGLLQLHPLGQGWLERLTAGTLALLAVRDAQGRILHATPRGRAVPADADTAPAGELLYQLEHFVTAEQLRLTVGVEVTARQQAEDADRERAELYRLLLHSTEDFVGLVDPRGRHVFVNPAFYRATGYGPEEIQGTDFSTRVHPDDLAVVERTRDANLRGERTRVELRYRCKNGSYLWLDLRAAPIPGPGGKAERIVWTSHDVTDRKRLEHQLRESRLFIEGVADALPQMLFVYDLTEDRHVWVNARCEEIRGYTQGEILGMGRGEAVAQIHPDDRLGVEQAMAMLGGLGESEVLEIRYRILHRVMGYRLVRTRCLVFRRGPRGEPLQVLGVSELADERRGGSEGAVTC